MEPRRAAHEGVFGERNDRSKLQDLFPEEDLRAGRPERELEIARTQGHFEDEGWRVRKDGSRFWANVVIAPLRNEEGTIFGFGKVTRDLSARRQAEETERQLIREQAARSAAEESAETIRRSEQLARQAAMSAAEAASPRRKPID